MNGTKIVPKRTRMIAIMKKLPDGDFGKAILEKTIRETRVGERGIKSRQSVQEYIGLLIGEGIIETRMANMFRVTDVAKTPGNIVIIVESQLRIPLIRDLIERALNGADGVRIIDEVMNND